MNVADTSVAAYRNLKASGKVEDRKEMVVALLREMGGSGTAFDIMRHVQKTTVFSDDESRFRFVQNVHATVSELTKDGVLKCTGTDVNPSTGQDVKFYEINEGDVVAQPQVDKGYKKRFEELSKEYYKLKQEHLQAQSRLQVMDTDSITKDTLADIFYQAREKNDWTMIQCIFTKARQ